MRIIQQLVIRPHLSVDALLQSSLENNKESEVSISLMIQIKIHKQHVVSIYYHILSRYITMMSVACHEMG